MEFLISSLHVCLCFFLIIVVLLQPGKGGDISSAFGGGTSQSVFGARGATSLLQTVTQYVAVLFMCTTIILAWMSNEALRRGSVMSEDAVKELLPPAPPAPAGAPLPDIAPEQVPAGVAPDAGSAVMPGVPVDAAAGVVPAPVVPADGSTSAPVPIQAPADSPVPATTGTTP